MTEILDKMRRPGTIALAGLAIWSVCMIWISWDYGVVHDYRAYLKQWRSLIETGDPWIRGNAYGPLHQVVGLLYPVDRLAPKMLMVGAMVVANFALFFDLVRTRRVTPIQWVYLLAIPTNLLIYIVAILYGLNDALVAALLIAAVLARHRSLWVTCGTFVALAALLKFYPLLLLPFFAIDTTRINWRVLISGGLVFAAGLIAAWMAWGNGFLDAMLFGANRGPKLLSVIRSIDAAFGRNAAAALITYNTEMVMLGVLGAFALSIRMRLVWLESAVLGYLVMLTVYKVGHNQFYIPWLFMVAALPLLNRKSADRMAVVFLPMCLFLSLYQFGYHFASDGYRKELGWVRDYVGFVAFAISITSISVALVFRPSPDRQAVD